MIITRIRLRYYPVLLFLAVPILVLIACDNPVYPTFYSPYHCPVDCAYMAIENLNYAYISQDVGHYMNCFSKDFEFNYISNGDTISWGFVTEMNIHYPFMFLNVDMIELTFSGSEEYPWSGDTTGSTLVLPREYDLKVSMVPDSVEYRALGTAHFICRQDSLDEWYVWQWWDYPDPGKDGWGDIKVLFMTPPSNH